MVGYITERFWERYNIGIALSANIIGGILVVYLIGIPFTAVVAGVGLGAAFTGSAVFLPGDLVKVVIASLAAVAVRRAYPVIETSSRT